MNEEKNNDDITQMHSNLNEIKIICLILNDQSRIRGTNILTTQINNYLKNILHNEQIIMFNE